MLITEADVEANFKALKESGLQQVLYIYYLTQFKVLFIKALSDIDSKVNIMQAKFISKSSLSKSKTNVGGLKIDIGNLEID